MKKAIKDSSITLGGNILGIVLSIFTGMVGARLLKPEGRGVLAALQTFPGFLSIPIFFGFPQSLAFFTARKPTDAGHYLGSAIGFSLLMCVPVCLIGGWFEFTHILRQYPRDIRLVGLVYLICYLPVSVVIGLPLSIFSGVKRFDLVQISRLTPPMLYALVLSGAWVLFVTTPTTILLTYLIVLCLVLSPLIWGLYLRNVRQKPQWSLKHLKEIMGYSALSLLNEIPSLLNQNVDQIFIAAILPPRELGLYSIAVAWSMLLVPITSPISVALFPRLAEASSADATRLLQISLRWYLVIISGLVPCLIIATPILLPLMFGRDFEGSIPPAFVLSIAGGFYALNTFLAKSLAGLGHPAISLVANLVGVAMTASGLWLFLRIFGIMGAAWVSLVAYVTTTIVLLVGASYVIPMLWHGWGPAYQQEMRLIFRWVVNAFAQFSRRDQENL